MEDNNNHQRRNTERSTMLMVPVVYGNDDDNSISLYEITCHDAQGYHLCRQWFSPITLNENPYITNIDTRNSIARLLEECVIALPLDSPFDLSDETSYSFVDKNWLQRNQNGYFKLPEISKSIFEAYHEQFRMI